MRRATTPTHRFTLQFPVETIKSIRITYAQGGKNILRKENGEITMDGKTAIVRLTQEETKLFTADKDVEIQVRILTLGGDAPASGIMRTNVERILDDEVLV